MPFLKQTGDLWSMAFGLNNYGEVARAQGDYEKAEGYYRRTEAIVRAGRCKGRPGSPGAHIWLHRPA